MDLGQAPVKLVAPAGARSSSALTRQAPTTNTTAE